MVIKRRTTNAAEGIAENRSFIINHVIARNSAATTVTTDTYSLYKQSGQTIYFLFSLSLSRHTMWLANPLRLLLLLLVQMLVDLNIYCTLSSSSSSVSTAAHISNIKTLFTLCCGCAQCGVSLNFALSLELVDRFPLNFWII